MCLKFPEFEAGCAYKLVAYKKKSVLTITSLTFWCFGYVRNAEILCRNPNGNCGPNKVFPCSVCTRCKRYNCSPSGDPNNWGNTRPHWNTWKAPLQACGVTSSKINQSSDIRCVLAIYPHGRWISNGIVSCLWCYFVQIQSGNPISEKWNPFVTDGRTEEPSYRDVRTHLKALSNAKFHYLYTGMINADT